MAIDVQTTELQLKNYKAMLERRNESEIRELEARKTESIQKLTDELQNQMNTIKTAYDVKISEEGEALEQRLNHIRANHEERIENEKRAGEEELQKVKNSYQKK